MIDQPISIGELRWKVSLASRVDQQDPASADLLEKYSRILDVWAKITPVKGEAFIGGEQIETPVTHEIVIRWMPYEDVGMFDTILRYSNLPNGERRCEVYRIRDIKEWDGRLRFLIIDAELERFAG